MSVLILSGSPSLHPSRSSALLARLSLRLRAGAHVVERWGVRDVPSDDLVQVRRDGAAAMRLQALVARSAAIVVGTPVYNASIPGGLKALLDLLPPQAFHGKPVLVLATGGSAGHQLAIEYSLKPVLSSLGARHVLAGVFATESDVTWQGDASNAPTFSAALAERLDDAADVLLALLGVQTAADGASVAWPGGSRPVVASGTSTVLAAERCSA